MADLTRLKAPNGSTVRVSAERAKALLEQGYKSAEQKSKATASKSSSSKKSD